MKEAVLDWSKSGFTQIRKDQMNGVSNRAGEIIEDYVSNKSDPETLYRGIVRGFDEPDLKVGDIIDQKGTSSWTKSQISADSFANTLVRDGVATIFILENGTKSGADVSELKGAGRRRERETIISKKSRQKVKKIEFIDGKQYITLEEI